MKRHSEILPYNPTDNYLESGRSRRSFLKFMSKAALVAITADAIAGEMLWGGTNPEIHVLHDAIMAEKVPQTYTLAIGGFNVFDMEGLAKTVTQLLPEYGQVAYLKLPDNGIHIGDITRKAIEFIEKNDVLRLRIYGHSMGGMLGLQLGAELKDKVPYLEAIMLDCTPSSHYDLRDNKKTGTWFLHAADKAELYLGPIARSTAEAISPIIDGHDDVFEVCKNAIRKVVSGRLCSNQLVEAQASVIRTFNAADFRSCFGDDTHILHLHPENYDADQTVNSQTALAGFRTGLDRRVIAVPIKGSGHADPGTHTREYTNALGPVAQRCGFFRGYSSGHHPM